MPPSRRQATRPATTWGTRIGAGPRLLLLHGGPGLDHHTLVPLAEELAHGFEVWLPDLPGHGASPRRPGLPETLRQLERAVATAAFSVVAGHSLGAWLVRELGRRDALGSPDGVVLLAPPGGERNRVKLAGAGRGSVARDVLAQVETELGRPASARFTACLAEGTLRWPREHEQLVKGLGQALSRPVARWRAPCPVWIVHGERDSVVSAHDVALVADATPGSMVITLPEPGHFPGATAGDGTAAAISRWLRPGATR